MKRVFMGGTCNESQWRNQMMEYLHDECMEYFNPVIDSWTADAETKEIRERASCDFCLYTLTPIT